MDYKRRPDHEGLQAVPQGQREYYKPGSGAYRYPNAEKEAIYVQSDTDGLQHNPEAGPLFVGTGGQVIDRTGDGRERRKYCGLSRTVFIILLVAAALLVLGAAIGGGVGGALASKSSSSASNTSSANHSHTATAFPQGAGSSSSADAASAVAATSGVSTSTNPTSPTTTQTISTPSASSSATHITSSTSTFAAPTSATTALGTYKCPAENGTTYTPSFPGTYTFLRLCSIDWPTGATGIHGQTLVDLEAVIAESIESCIDQCAAYSNANGLLACSAVVYGANITRALARPGISGNCFLKTQKGVTNLADHSGQEEGAYVVSYTQ